ncbi:MMPL family [Gaiella occulta]|uniref:MMPL family n=1 Tax=Gaiella occulta TaxID=1002870 RepID=A0A7M2YXP0_9ACTN|nr:MMPL family transporter [Gaiella occulta]RDI74248.1 MMPL family [Gaiella occulta]
MSALIVSRARLVTVVAALAIVVAFAAGNTVVPRMNAGADQFADLSSESRLANREVERRTGVEADPGILALVRGGAGEVARVRARIAADPSVALTLVDDRGVVLVFLRSGAGEDSKAAADRLARAFARDANVRLGGGVIASRQVTEAIQRDLRRAELIAFPLVLLLSFWVFRGLVAAFLPPLVGAGAIALTLLGLRVGVEVHPLSVFALNLVTGLGLGLAIDYSLFVVSRWREEARRTGFGPEAMARTLRTAGRTVLFSALTVAASMACLLVFPQQFLYSMGLGGVLVALSAGVVALVPLPAFLYWLGPRIDALAPRRLQQPPSGGRWARLAAWVMRRPGRVAALSAAVLVLLAAPALGVHFVGVDASTLPASASARQVAEALDRGGVSGRYAPITAVADARPGDVAVARIAALPGVAAVLPAREAAPGLWRLDVLPREKGLAASTQRVVREVRRLLPDARVTGQTAAFVDQQASLARHLPWALGILALTTALLIFLFTGSLLLPLKSLVMNVFTLGASFGILVLVFERWRGLDGLESTQPILLGATAFGLSTDYAIFLFSRIREARDRGLRNRAAVADGLERTGRIVTAAALLFCVAIGTFATSGISFILELGVGTAAAVALDATIVRALLVPSLMALLGEWNWWAPAPLRRLHARLGLAA